MAKHEFNVGVRGKAPSMKKVGVTHMKANTSDRTKAPEVQAQAKRFVAKAGF